MADKPEQPAHAEGVSLARCDFLLALAVAAVALGVYIFTLAPGLLRADSGELQTLAVTLGYAHPTGYPVYLLLAKVFTLIPVGDVAYRVNLLSAVMGAAGAGLLYLLGRLLTGKRFLPVAGAFALALSPTFWSQAIIAEVYTTGVVCMLGVLLGIALWQRTGQVRWLFAAACLGGMSLGVHSTHALMAPAAMLIVAITPRRWIANWTAAVLGAVTGAAITLAAFALIDSADSPAGYFHAVINPSRSLWDLEPEDLDGFFDRVELSMNPPQFRGLLFSQTWDLTRQKAVDYSRNLPSEFPPLWFVAVGAGLVWLGRRNWKITLLLVLSYAAHLAYNLNFDGVVHVLYIATYVPLAVLGIAGLAWLSDALQALAAHLGKPAISPAAWDRLAAAAGLCLVIWPMAFTDAWNVEGRRRVWLPPQEQDTPFRVEYSAQFHRQVRELIDDLEPDAVVFVGWCLVYPYYYVAHVEQGRTQMQFIHDYPMKDHFDLADSALEYVRQVSPQRPVYFADHRAIEKRPGKLFELRPVRRGRELLYRVGGIKATKSPR